MCSQRCGCVNVGCTGFPYLPRWWWLWCSISEMPHRLPAYAALTGIVVARSETFADMFFERLNKKLHHALQELDTITIKLLVGGV